MSNRPPLQFRQAGPADLDAIMAIEQHWPEDERASRECLASRLRWFSQGFFLIWRDTEPVGSITSCPIRYEPANVTNLRSWAAVTNNGYLSQPAPDSNALYIVSGVVIQSARGTGVFEAMISHMEQVARRLGYAYILAGAVLPGYDAYCRRHGEIPAAENAFLQRRGRLVDPFLEAYRRLGFQVPDARHVVADYYPDGPSRHNAGLVVKAL